MRETGSDDPKTIKSWRRRRQVWEWWVGRYGEEQILKRNPFQQIDDKDQRQRFKDDKGRRRQVWEGWGSR